MDEGLMLFCMGVWTMYLTCGSLLCFRVLILAQDIIKNLERENGNRQSEDGSDEIELFYRKRKKEVVDQK